jgi:hypothetical protein
MDAELNSTPGELHWQVIAELIRRNENLRSAVTLRVSGNNFDFADGTGRVLARDADSDAPDFRA